MLKLQSTLKESAKTMFEDGTHYEVMLNEQRIGTFTKQVAESPRIYPWG